LIEIYTKDFRHIKLSFLPSRSNRGRLFKLIREDRLQPNQFFCFSHKVPVTDHMIDGWNVYDPLREYSRQGVFRHSGDSAPSWRLTSVNEDYKMCDTYPKYFAVPSGISDEEIRAVALFRSKGRIPVLCWYDDETGVALTRSSQPLIGLGIRGKKYKDDYRMIESIIQANSKKSGEKLMIVDLRPRANAEANRLVRGAGYEKNYKNCDLKFMGIENIHVVRASFAKLMDVCMSAGGMDAQWYSKVESTQWIEHMRTILSASQYIVSVMEREKVSVLTHCSDGWDRTSQVVCLSQIMLDPYFRTVEGFAVLLEKEWLAFGHMFHKRMGHGLANAFFHDERGPIFVQFMDCIYQFIKQHPTAFEFNEQFLLYILDECYACRYGTFLFDCDRERYLHKVREFTPSMWTRFLNRSLDVNHELDQFYNPFYDPEQTLYTLYPDLRHSSTTLWSGYWLRFSKEPNGYEYYFPDSDRLLHHRAMDFLRDVQQMQEYKNRAESKNEATVMTFQREFKSMWEQIEILTKKEMEWKLRYETDTNSLLEMCEKQRDELSKWRNTSVEAEQIRNIQSIHDAQLQQSSSSTSSSSETNKDNNTSETTEKQKKDDTDENVESLVRDRDNWKKKALDFQVELLNMKNQSTPKSKDEEITRLQQYISHLESTLQLQQQKHMSLSPRSASQIPTNRNSGGASPVTDAIQMFERRSSTEKWNSVNETWRNNKNGEI
jgi:hypothetical protein